MSRIITIQSGVSDRMILYGGLARCFADLRQGLAYIHQAKTTWTLTGKNVLGSKSQLSTINKLLLYKTILKSICIYEIHPIVRHSL